MSSPMHYPSKLYITGGPGTGKSTLAHRIGMRLSIPIYELDRIWLALEERNEPFEAIFAERDRIAATNAWIAEGAYLGWTIPLLQQADLIVFLDVPWRVACFRIVVRHIKRELAGNNPFPGWRRLYRFLRSTQRYYQDVNPPGINRFGFPNSHATVIKELAPYTHKLLSSTHPDFDARLAHILST